MSKFIVDWVVVNEIAIGRAPRKPHHFESLRNQGLNAILNLCFKEEYQFDETFIKSFTYSNIPLHDHRTGKLPTQQEILNAMNALDSLKKKGPVYVHCFAAVERSPLVCMAWLINKKNFTVNDSLEYMMEVHQGTCPLPTQLKILNGSLINPNGK